MRLDPECKVRQNSTPEVVFISTAPVHSGPPLCDVGGVNVPLTVIHTDTPLASLDTSRRVLTASDALVDAVGIAGTYGDAYLQTLTAGSIPVEVVEISEATITLADPVPRGVDVAGATLLWATYTGTFPALKAQVLTDSVPLLWTVTWKSRRGAKAPVEDLVLDGQVHVRIRPFSTGLSHHHLLEHFRALGTQVPRQDQGYESVIRLAEGLIITRIRKDLRGHTVNGRPATEDDMRGGDMRTAHATLTASMILERRPAGGSVGIFESDVGDDDEDGISYAASLRRRAFAMLKDILETMVWIDEDGDGEIDAGETDQAISGVDLTVVNGMPSIPTGGSTYKRDMYH